MSFGQRGNTVFTRKVRYDVKLFGVIGIILSIIWNHAISHVHHLDKDI